MPRPKLDKIADSTFSFRIEEKEADKLNKRIAALRKKLNNEISDDEYQITKNEIIVSALKLGLKSLGLQDLPKRLKKKGEGV